MSEGWGCEGVKYESQCGTGNVVRAGPEATNVGNSWA